MNSHDEPETFEVYDARGARSLLGQIARDPQAGRGPAYVVGRELILLSAQARHDWDCMNLLHAAYYVLSDGYSSDDEVQAENKFWLGIEEGLTNGLPWGSLERAFNLFLQLGNPTKAGRCAEELAEWFRFKGDQEAEKWFETAERCFQEAGRDDRLRSLATARRGERLPSSFLLRRPLTEEASSILGSSTGYELRARFEKENMPRVHAEMEANVRRLYGGPPANSVASQSTSGIEKLRRFWRS